MKRNRLSWPEKSKSNVAQHTSVPPASIPSNAGVSPTKPSDDAPFAAASHTEVPPNVPSVEPTTHSYGTRRRSLGVRKKQLGRKG
ncbi:hypothetical protein Tco_1435804, partial [Tanacetum coccineum]